MVRIGGDERARRGEVLFGGPDDEGGGAGDVGGAERRVAAAKRGAEELVVGLVAAEDDERAAGEAEVAAVVERLDEAEVVQPFVFHEVAEAAAVVGLGELAAAGGGGVAADAELLRKLHLGLAVAALQGEQALAVDEAFELRLGGVEELRAERAEQAPAGAGEVADAVEGPALLGHGALAEHLAGGDEVEAVGLGVLPGAPDHAGVAVDAGVEAGAEAGGRVAEKLELVVGEVDAVDREAELAAGGGHAGGRREERGGEGDRLGLDALVAQDAECEQGVEPAGAEAERAGGWAGGGGFFRRRVWGGWGKGHVVQRLSAARSARRAE